MGKPIFDKWLDGLNPDDTVEVVLTESLRSRIAAVRHYLPLAAEPASDDVEYVHQLRVWTRRSMAVLDLYKPFLPKKRARWLRKRLRQIRKAAGAARDCDILIASHRNDPDSPQSRKFQERLHLQRRDAQQPIVSICKQLKEGKRLKRKSKKLILSLTDDTTTEAVRIPFADWARDPLQHLVDRFADAAPSDPSDPFALHPFRIRGKEFRYGIELLAPAFSVDLKERIAPELRKLQEWLGKLNDLAVAVRRLERWIDAEDDPEDLEHLRELLKRESEQQERTFHDFQAWWSPDHMQRFLSAVTHLLSDSIGTQGTTVIDH